MPRPDRRRANQLRTVKIVRRFTRYAGGSVLISLGHTQVLCTACLTPGVPGWMDNQDSGWLTAEYNMLPSSTPERKRRDNRPGGRSQEIQRLIGRCLRAVVDFKQIGSNTIWIDCDVLQADGGTRTAAITGSYVALVDCLVSAGKKGLLAKDCKPLITAVAAASAGVVNGKVLLDLSYQEDCIADVDFNIVMTGAGKFVEIQGTAEQGTFDKQQLDKILNLARRGIGQLLKTQQQALAGK